MYPFILSFYLLISFYDLLNKVRQRLPRILVEIETGIEIHDQL